MMINMTLADIEDAKVQLKDIEHEIEYILITGEGLDKFSDLVKEHSQLEGVISLYN